MSYDTGEDNSKLQHIFNTQGTKMSAQQKLKKKEHFNWNYNDEMSPKTKKKMGIDPFANKMRSVRGRLKSKKQNLENVYNKIQQI